MAGSAIALAYTSDFRVAAVICWPIHSPTAVSSRVHSGLPSPARSALVPLFPSASETQRTTFIK